MDFISSSFFESDIYIIAAALILSLPTAIYMLRRRRALVSQSKTGCAEDVGSGGLPAVSVVVYADNTNCDFLEDSIRAIMSQNYDDYEVIVAYYDYSDCISDVLTRLSVEYPLLRNTFVPDSNKNISVRKLATMLGIKAAKNDVVVLTAADYAPESQDWLRAMACHFDESTGLVVGYSRPNSESDGGVGHRYRSFEGVMDASQYLASASRGRVFRGDRNNIAYRKQLFFDNKGFSRHMNLKYGDDDIFISEIAGFTDSAVEISPAGIISQISDADRSRFGREKRHRAFTIEKLCPRAMKVGSAMTAVRCAFLLCVAVLVARACMLWLASPDRYVEPAILGGSAVVLYLAEVSIYISSYRKIAGILQAPRLLFTLPFFRFLRPIVSLYYKIQSSRTDNYTWE